MMFRISRNLIVIIIFIIFLSTLSYNIYQSYKIFYRQDNVLKLENNNEYQAINFFTEIVTIVKSSYYKNINLNTLMNYAIQGMLQNLDSYSYILKPKEMNTLQTELQNEFIGLGLQIVKLHTLTEVVNVLPNSPAKLAGIIRGDLITHIGNTPTTSLSLDQVSKKLQGATGTLVQLKLLRYPNKKIVTNVIRKKVNINANPLLVRTHNNIVYIKINIFNQNISTKLQRAIIQEKNNNTKGIIIDLRNNPGGLLEEAIRVTDLFINNGVILFIYGKNNKVSHAFKSQKQDIIPSIPIIVLVNHNSASAAEIVAGSLQSYKRATIIGTKSFGKGSLQSIIPLSKNRSLKLTTGLYILPKGEKVNKRGITPNVTVFANGDICTNCNEFQINKFTSSEIEYLSQHQQTIVDYQLQYAYKLLNKKR